MVDAVVGDDVVAVAEGVELLVPRLGARAEAVEEHERRTGPRLDVVDVLLADLYPGHARAYVQIL